MLAELSFTTKVVVLALVLPVLLQLYEIYQLITYQNKARKRGLRVPYTIFRCPLGMSTVWGMASSNYNGRVLEYLDEVCCRESGRMTARFKYPGGFPLYTGDHENVKALLSTQADEFVAGGNLPDQLRVLLVDSILTLHGPAWNTMRTLVRPSFSRKRIITVGRLEKFSEAFIAIVRERQSRAGKGRPIDVDDLCITMALDASTELLLGEGTSSMADMASDMGIELKHNFERSYTNDVTSKQFFRAIEHMLMIVSWRILLQDMYWLANTPATKRYADQCYRFIDNIIIGRMKQRQEMEAMGIKRDTENDNFLDSMINETSDVTLIRNQALSFLLAGRDSTASTMSMAISLLAQHPDVFKKLQQEVLDAFGTGAENLTMESILRCDYLKYVTHEVLRYLSPVSILQRNPIKDTTLPRGGGPNEDEPILVTKGTAILVALYSMHRDKKIWGEDADAFRPERWETVPPEKVAWGYNPFGGGPKACIGRKASLVTIGYLLIRLVQTFGSLENHDGPEGPEMLFNLIHRPKNGIRVRFQD